MKNSIVVALAFGVNCEVNIAPTNSLLAEFTENLVRGFNCPVITQQDISSILPEGLNIINVREKTGHPPPTLRILIEAVWWASGSGVEHIIIVCAKPHQKRVEADMKFCLKLFFRSKITFSFCEEIDTISYKNWFDPNNAQTRIRSSDEWEKREKTIEKARFFYICYNLLSFFAHYFLL